jgi:hypothetical protein
VKGSPKSVGRAKAVAISRRTCRVDNDEGRPSGLGASSNPANPVRLKRYTQSYTVVRCTPTRSAISDAGRPRAASATTRYRPYTRADNFLSLSFARNNRRSVGRSARNRTCTGRAISPPGGQDAPVACYWQIIIVGALAHARMRVVACYTIAHDQTWFQPF